MTTCSSVFAGKILWTEEPGGLQSMGLQRVGGHRVCTHRKRCVTTPSGPALPTIATVSSRLTHPPSSPPRSSHFPTTILVGAVSSCPASSFLEASSQLLMRSLSELIPFRLKSQLHSRLSPLTTLLRFEANTGDYSVERRHVS